METNESKAAENKLWLLLNSNFGLFIMSSIVLSLVSWSYSEMQRTGEAKAQQERLTERLGTEIRYRNLLLELKISEYKANKTDTSQTNLFYDMEEIVKGKTEILTEGNKDETEFSPVFSEFANKGMLALYWEYFAVTKASHSEQAKQSISSLIEFNIFLHKLIIRDMDTDEEFSDKDLAQLENTLTSFKAPIGSNIE